MKEWFEGKTVALVGNAESLFNQNYAEQIDSHESVVRINNGIKASTNRFHKEFFGSKTTVWMFNLYNKHLERTERLNSFPGIFKMQMNEEISSNFHHSYPRIMLNELSEITFPKMPTTGLRAIHYILSCDPDLLSVYGFDWKETPTFYDKKANDTRHDYDKEKDYCLALSKTNNKIKFYK